jgi:riboflavin synthase
MFTGLVQARSAVSAFERRGGGALLQVANPGWDVARGESIAVAGACLSALAAGRGPLAFELSSETLERTWFAELAAPAEPRAVNLERALALGDRLGGHLVSGHVDCLARVASLAGQRDGGWTLCVELEAPPAGGPDPARYLVHKGSVALDGVSLTVLRPAARAFEVALIPATFDHTTLGAARPGVRLHVELDQVAKYLGSLVEPYLSGPRGLSGR